MTTTLIVGASGATGKHLVEQLLNMGQKVKIIVRTAENLPAPWKNNNQVTIITANVSEISEDDMAKHLSGCHAVASCLGHNISFKGIFGKPRRLVTDAVRTICNTIKKHESINKPIKFVLMNTSGNRNRDLEEPISMGERFVITLLRLLLPPHVDNEKAADQLRTKIGQDDKTIEWVAVRPDNLVNGDKVTEYETFPSPIRSAIFNAGTTSRINVGHFMADLIVNDNLWNKWRGQMPVVYNKSTQ